MDLNAVSFTGRLGVDPSMKFLSNESAVTSFRFAVQVAPEKTLWFDVSVWGKLAELVNKYTKKGSRVAVTGRIDQDDWVGDDGKRRTTLKIIANSVIFLDPKGSSSESSVDESLVSSSTDVFEDDDFPL